MRDGAAQLVQPVYAILMPEMDGEATRQIMAGGGACRIVILTTFDLDAHVYAALHAGDSGFLLKDVSPEQLSAAVRLVAAGNALLAPSIAQPLIARFARPAEMPAVASHTAREMEVLKLIARGLNNAEIAVALVLSEATVKTHVARIPAKLDLRDRVQAVVLAYESGIVQAGGV